ncbi:MAG: glycine betaine ABC transporter substrate-binding protein [Ahrensia sp.]|nr:glycine betaine ABC transporter substrate-binding protein [Ahrensia sp.]
MKKTICFLLATTALLVVFTSSAQASRKIACGDVSIAEMNWASAGVAAQVDKIILEKGYGCKVEMVVGDARLRC